MKREPPISQRPIEEVKRARAFYADLGHDVVYFSALWHTFNVGHMLATDLDRICREHCLSLADFNLMGALRIDRPEPLRATDLAITLQVSNASLTSRIKRLVHRSILVKLPTRDDRRAFSLQLTSEGVAMVDAIHTAIAEDSHFVRCIRQLTEEDRLTLERIMGELHAQLDRDFVHVHR